MAMSAKRFNISPSLSLSLSLSLYNSTSELRILKWLGMVLLHDSVREV